MLDPATLEQRLLALEAEVAALKQQSAPPRMAENWLDHLIGSISDDQGFEQVLEYGRAFRNRDRPPETDDEPA